MYENYKSFLEEFDKKLEKLFENQKNYIYCKKGCSLCCEKGDYPFSQLEFGYLTQGYLSLPEKTKIIVQQNINSLNKDKKEFKGGRFEHICPFLINNKCCVYKYRGIICRTFGICYYDDKKNYIKLPGCVNYGLNYSKQYNKKTKELNIEDIPQINLRIDSVLNSELAKKYNINCGEIRSMLDWFIQK